MGSKQQRSPSSDSSSSSESEEEQAASAPPAIKPSLKSTSPKTKPSKSLQPPSSDDEEDEDGEPPVSQKKKEVSVKKDEKKNEEEGSSDEEDEKHQEEEDEDDEDEGSGNSDEEKQQLSKKLDSIAISASEKPAAAGIVTPAASGRKRQRDSAPSEQQHTKTKKPFQRIWGVDDEIKILKTIKAFYSNKGSELLSNTVSSADLDAIHSLIMKKSLGLEFTRRQLSRKIRDLRMKFQTNVSQRTNNTDLKFSNPQQQEIYELSKKIWRPDKPNLNEAPKGSGKSVKSKGKSALKVMKDQEKIYIPEGGLWEAVAEHGGISWALIQRGLNLVDPEKARALEKKFFQLELAKMRHHLQWLDKREEAIQLVSDGMKKSG